MRRQLDRAWRWSFLVTVPIAILFAQWATRTWRQWRAFALDFDASPAVVRLRDVGLDQWNHTLRAIDLGTSLRTPASLTDPSALRAVQLFVPDIALQRLGSDLPYSGLEFVDGQLMYPDGLHQVKVRYRGDFLPHWGYDKKSIRVKTKADDLFDGMRAFNLIVPKFPEQVNNWSGYRLAALLGLLSPRCELVNVYVNGRNAGLHAFTEQLDDGVLRRWQRMPGDLYAGEQIGRDRFEGTTARIFEMPEQWEKIAVNDRYDPASKAPLQALVRLLNDTPSEPNQAALSQLLDMRAFGTFGAYELLTQTHHFDEYHNWRLYWDPWALRFEPVVWDPTPWTAEVRPQPGQPVAQDLVISRLHVWLHRNGDFLAARHQALRDFYGKGTCDRFVAELDQGLAAARQALEFDPNTRPTDPAVIEDAIVSFRAFVEQTLREVRLTHLEATGTVRYTPPSPTGAMRLEVSGRQPVSAIVLRYQRPVERASAATLGVRRGGQRFTTDLSGGVVAQGNELRVPVRLFAQLAPHFRDLPGQALRQHTLQPEPTCYELQLDELPRDNPLLEVLARRDDVDERAVPVAAIAERDADWLYRASAPNPVRRPQLWSGQVAIDGIRHVADDVILEPGTTVLLAAKATLIFHGRVAALGTAEQPIRFLPAAPERGAWGALGLDGPLCNGSTFRHCEVRGGSGYRVPLADYSAMFAIHNCQDVRIEDCRFADNFEFEDMIHAACAEVVFDRVELQGARADALDCDLSRVQVRSSRFGRSGKHGLDLTASQAVVHDSTFEQNGEGNAIGDGSSLLALRNVYDGCQLALAVSNGSIACAVNCELRNCAAAGNAWRLGGRFHDGGRLTILKSRLAGNQQLPTADGDSQMQLVDCQLEGKLAERYTWTDPAGKKHTQRNHAELLDCDAGAGVRSRAPLPFPAALQHLEALAAPIWRSVRSDVRGGARVE